MLNENSPYPKSPPPCSKKCFHEYFRLRKCSFVETLLVNYPNYSNLWVFLTGRANKSGNSPMVTCHKICLSLLCGFIFSRPLDIMAPFDLQQNKPVSCRSTTGSLCQVLEVVIFENSQFKSNFFRSLFHFFILFLLRFILV